MSQTPFMPLWVADFVGDTLDLDAREIGAYMLILMTMWGRGGALPNDQKKLQRVARCGRDWPKVWDAIGPYFTVEGDAITQGRLRKELQKVTAKREVNAQSGARGGRAKALKSKELYVADATIPPKQPEPEPEPDIREGLGKPNPGQPDNSQACFDHFNAVAGQVGWAKIQKITAPRKAALSQRMRDVGGVDGWCAAIDRAALSPLLTGQSGRGWVADFDWLCKASNFTKLMEGNYDPRPANNSTADRPRRAGDGSGTIDAFAAVAARHSGRAQ